MIKSIWKYAVNPGGEFEHDMPVGAEVLAVATQHGVPVMWAKVGLTPICETRRFKTEVTGLYFDDVGLSYIGTFQLDGGDFVGHVFEVSL